MKKLIFGFLISCSIAHAGLPPTTSKGFGESSPSTTFAFEFPYFPITHTGTRAALGVLRVDGGGTGTGTAFTQGSVLFAGASGVYSQNNSNFFWDNSNSRLGLGLTAPTSKLHIDGGNATASALKMTAGTTTGQASTDGFEFGIDSSGNGEIRQREALEVRLFTNNTQRVTVQSGGNVGIGTTSPISKMHIVDISGSAASFLVSGASKGVRIGSTGSGSWIDGVDNTGFGSYQPLTVNGSQLTFSINNSPQVSINSLGNVGIGTTTVGAKLHVVGAGATSAKIETAGTDGSNAALTLAGAGTNASWTMLTNNSTLSGAVDSLGFYKNSGSTGMKMVLTDSGSLGLGTTTVGAKLDIYGGAATTNPVINITNTGNGTGGAGAFYGLKMNLYPHNQQTAAYSIYSVMNSQGYNVPTGSIYGEVVGAATAGLNSKGIWGKASQPNAAGYGMATGVYGEATTGGTGTVSTTYAGYFTNTSTVGGTNYGIYANAATGGTTTIPLAVAVDGTEKMRVSSSGYVGIGTTGPGSTLHVSGSYQAAVSALTTNTTLDATHQVVTVDASGGARTITLPDCVAGILGRTYRIKKIDSSANTVTLARTGSDDTFDGATSYTITNQYQSVDVVCVSTTLWGLY